MDQIEKYQAQLELFKNRANLTLQDVYDMNVLMHGIRYEEIKILDKRVRELGDCLNEVTGRCDELTAELRELKDGLP